MLCERCGKDISDMAAICPSCGTLTSEVRPAGQPPTQHGPYSTDTYDEPMSSYEQGYTPRQDYRQPPSNYKQLPWSNYVPPSQSNYQYGQSYAPPQFRPSRINVSVYNSYTNDYTPPIQKNTGALIAEIILSLFGIFGVGWLISGEITIGTLLLVGSLVLYMPIAILGIVFTFGLGIFCFSPLSITAVIINAVLLNNVLNRKAAQKITVIQAQPMPPQYPHYQ